MLKSHVEAVLFVCWADNMRAGGDGDEEAICNCSARRLLELHSRIIFTGHSTPPSDHQRSVWNPPMSVAELRSTTPKREASFDEMHSFPLFPLIVPTGEPVTEAERLQTKRKCQALGKKGTAPIYVTSLNRNLIIQSSTAGRRTHAW